MKVEPGQSPYRLVRFTALLAIVVGLSVACASPEFGAQNLPSSSIKPIPQSTALPSPSAPNRNPSSSLAVAVILLAVGLLTIAYGIKHIERVYPPIANKIRRFRRVFPPRADLADLLERLPVWVTRPLGLVVVLVASFLLPRAIDVPPEPPMRTTLRMPTSTDLERKRRNASSATDESMLAPEERELDNLRENPMISQAEWESYGIPPDPEQRQQTNLDVPIAQQIAYSSPDSQHEIEIMNSPMVLGHVLFLLIAIGGAPIYRRIRKPRDTEAEGNGVGGGCEDDDSGVSPKDSLLYSGLKYQLEITFQPVTDSSYEQGRASEIAFPRIQAVIDGVDVKVVGNPFLDFGDVSQGSAKRFVEFTPLDTSIARIRVDFYQDNAFIRQFVLEIGCISTDEQPRVGQSDRENPTDYEIVSQLEPHKKTLPAIAPYFPKKRLHLRITHAPNDNEASYSAFAHDGHVWKTLDVRIRQDDLNEIAIGLRTSLRDLRDFYTNHADIPGTICDSKNLHNLLNSLARRGNDAYKRIFPLPSDRDFLRAALDGAAEYNIEIASSGFFLPWELLYPDYREDRLDLEGFWGFQYNISRVLTDSTRQSCQLAGDNRSPRIMLVPYHRLDSVRRVEIPFFRRLKDEGRIELYEWEIGQNDSLPQVPPGSNAQASLRQREMRKDFFTYCRSHQSDIIHFACHAVVNDQYSRESYLVLGNDLQVNLEDMSVDELRLVGNPVVVINACGTGIRDPRKTSDFVREFIRCGSQGVIATETDVPDYFAAEFAAQFYDSVLAGWTFGEALLNTRMHFLRRNCNPLGLLYSSYLSLDAFLVNSMPYFTISFLQEEDI